MYYFCDARMLDVLEKRKCGALVEHMPNEQVSRAPGSFTRTAGIIPRDTSFDSCQGQ